MCLSKINASLDKPGMMIVAVQVTPLQSTTRRKLPSNIWTFFKIPSLLITAGVRLLRVWANQYLGHHGKLLNSVIGRPLSASWPTGCATACLILATVNLLPLFSHAFQLYTHYNLTI